MNRNVATAVLFAFLFAMMLSVRTPETSSVEEGGPRTVSYSQMVEMAQSGQVKTAVLAQGLAYGVNADGGNAVVAVVPEGQAMAEILRQAGVDVRLRPRPVPSPWAGLIGAVLPIFLFFAIYYFIMRKMQGATGMLGRSKAKLVPEVDRGRTTFDNVAGVEEAKVELAEIVEFLRDREKFVQLGAKIPRGVLLVGPPGTGKTLLARAVAGEAGVPFFTTSGSDFVEMFVGLGASRVREMFETARKAAPCILFIDEIDALGRSRGQGFGGGNDEREQTLNAMLVEMDGFSGDSGVIVMGATNRPDVLDRALLRPGRFDRQITVPNPDVKGREEILGVHARKVRLAPGADLKALARGTPGFSGADLANLINEAALLAARRNGKAITTRDLEAAKDRVMMGAERRTLTMSDEERRLTAYHEAGHALVGACMPDSPPVHKATIVPRGRSLGLVMRLPERDETTYSLARLRAEMAVAMAGRVAERIIFGPDKVTSGAESDIKQATGLARRMVTAWGFSDRIGPVRLTLGDDEGYLGRPAGGMQDGLSQSTTTVVDDEIRSIVEAGSSKAEEIITTRIDALHAIAQALLARETLDGTEIRALADGKPLPEPVPVQVPSWMGRSSVPDVRRAD